MNLLLPKVVALVTLALLAGWFGRLTSAPLKQGPGRILALEIAPTPAAANKFLTQWKVARPGDWRDLLLESLRWDTWFICTYAPLLCLAGWLAADHLARRHAMAGSFGHLLAAAQLFAGCCDFIENAGMRRSILAGSASSPWPEITCAASVTKWALLLVGVLYIVAALLDWLLLSRFR